MSHYACYVPMYESNFFVLDPRAFRIESHQIEDTGDAAVRSVFTADFLSFPKNQVFEEHGDGPH